MSASLELVPDLWESTGQLFPLPALAWLVLCSLDSGLT